MSDYGPRVQDMRARYAVALRAVQAAEYRDVFEHPAANEWGGDMTPAEWLDGFSTIDYRRPAGPITASAAADVDAILDLLGFTPWSRRGDA